VGVLVVLVVLATVPRAGAQSLGAAAQEASARQRVEAETVVRKALLQRVVRKVDRQVAAADARRIVSKLSDQQVSALLYGGDLASLLATSRTPTLADKASGQLASISEKALGDPESDLLFVPVTPCRIIDTRLAGGPLAANETRSFEVTGTSNFAAQGGAASGCGIPIGAVDPLAPAVVINFIAVGPAGPGDLRAWEFNQPVPTASVINYSNVPGLNIANGVVVPTAGVATLDKDISVKADVSGTHLVADVTGYFTRFPVEEFQGALKTSLFPGANTSLVDLSDGGCHELTSCTVTTTAAGQVMVEAWSQVVVNHSSGTQDRFVMQVETAGSVSCPEDNSVDASDYEIPSALGSNIDVDFTLSHARVFPQSSGQTVTYRLSGKMVDGAGSLDKVENSHLLCTFVPN
jgi:hypothetical protein